MIEEIIAKIKGFLLNPVETFQQSKDDNPKILLTYFAILLLVNSFFYTIVAYSGVGSYMGGLAPWGSGAALSIFVFALFSSFVLSALFILWLHLWVYILGGRKGIMRTARAFIYAGTPEFLLGWIPYIWIIFLIWSFVLAVLGIRELHELSTAKAAVALVIAIIIPLVLLVLLAAYFFVSYMTVTPVV